MLSSAGLMTSLACADSGPSPFADVVVTISTTGAAPATTTLGISIDGQDPLLNVIGDTLHLSMSPESHSFHPVAIPHNCPASNRPDPYIVTVALAPSPFPVDFTFDCF